MKTTQDIRVTLLEMLKEQFRLSDPVSFALGHNLEAKQIARAVIAVDRIGQPPQPTKRGKQYDVVLHCYGTKKLDCIKILKSYTGDSLMDAKRKVEALGTQITTDKKTAEHIAAELNNVFGGGVSAEVFPHAD